MASKADGESRPASGPQTPPASCCRSAHLRDDDAGLGGGADNDATSSLALTNSVVTLNHADGSPGIGGGVYTLGTFTFDALIVINDNHASTSGDNIGP